MAREKTVIVRGEGPDRCTGSISTPIYRSATYIHAEIGEEPGKYYYARCETPTRNALEREVARLEGGKGALATSSGMAAISIVLKLFNPGDHILVSGDLYGGTYRLFQEVYGRYGLQFEFVPTWDLEILKGSIRKNTKAIFVETPSNPCMHVTDIQAVSEIARAAHALLIVDNTFLSPYFQKPITFGADIVIHSATKYLAGHNDVLAGVVVTATEELRQKLYFYLMSEGCTLSADDAWLVLRGIKTLSVRLDREEENALKIVDFLKHHPKVEKIYYPGDPDHPDYELSRKQTTGFGGMLSFDVKGIQEKEEVLTFLKKFRIINVGGSLGGVESLITYPYLETQLPIPEEQKESVGVGRSMFRLSVGIEDVQDLIEDLDQALA